MREPFERFMIPPDQRWSVWREVTGEQQHADRAPLMRVVRIELSAPVHGGEDGATAGYDRAGLTINVGSGGLCLLLDWAPEVKKVFRLDIPMVGTSAEMPTLAEVRWTRPLPFGWNGGLYAVGLRFML